MYAGAGLANEKAGVLGLTAVRFGAYCPGPGTSPEKSTMCCQLSNSYCGSNDIGLIRGHPILNNI